MALATGLLGILRWGSSGMQLSGTLYTFHDVMFFFLPHGIAYGQFCEGLSASPGRSHGVGCPLPHFTLEYTSIAFPIIHTLSFAFERMNVCCFFSLSMITYVKTYDLVCTQRLLIAALEKTEIFHVQRTCKVIYLSRKIGCKVEVPSRLNPKFVEVSANRLWSHRVVSVAV